MDGAAPDGDVEGRRHRPEGDAGAGHQRLKEHVARAGQHPVPAGGGVQPGLDEGPAGLHGAADVLLPEPAVGPQGVDGRLRLGPVLILQGSLQGLEPRAIHGPAR